MNIEPVVLEGRLVRLEPLTVAHHPRLCEIGLDERLWRWTQMQVGTPDELLTYVLTALEWQAAGNALPFAIVERKSSRPIGSTRYANIDRVNRHLEIGWSWVAPDWQGTGANTEAKYLLLSHAFETLGCLRVEFKTDALNERSRAALRKIGATEEGTFRKHIITSTGRIRDSVYFSVIDDEWPDVKRGLERRLAELS